VTERGLKTCESPFERPLIAASLAGSPIPSAGFGSELHHIARLREFCEEVPHVQFPVQY
jgi:hypothetical protein